MCLAVPDLEYGWGYTPTGEPDNQFAGLKEPNSQNIFGLSSSRNELGRAIKDHRFGEAIYQRYDTEAEANRVWDRERAILEHTDVEQDARREMGTSERSAHGERSSPASPSISSQTTLTSQRAHPNRSDRRQRRMNDSSEYGESSPGPAAFLHQRVSVDTSVSSHSASNRSMRTRDQDISFHHRNEQNMPKQIRQATHTGTFPEGDRTASIRATVDTSYSYSGSSGDYDTCRTSQWAEQQSETSTRAFSRRDVSATPQTRRYKVFNNSEALPKSSAGRVRPSNLSKGPPTNRVISISTDDSDEEAVPMPNPAATVCQRISQPCCKGCSQNVTSRRVGGASSSSTKAVKVRAAKTKISRSVQTDRRGPTLQAQQVASGSRSASSRIPPIQRSSTLPADSSSSYKRNDCHKTIPRASTDPNILLDAFSGPPHGIGNVYAIGADPRSPIRRGGTAIPVEPGR